MIRRWQLKDVAAVVELEKKCFSDPWNADMILSSFNLPRFVGFVAEEDGAVAGYLGATRLFEDCEILLVAVDETYRRRKIATGLFNELFSLLKKEDVKRIFLEVRSRNDAALNCYSALGFTKIGLRAGYYGDDDAVIMEKTL